MLAPLDGRSSGGPGVDDRDPPPGETFMESGAGSFGSRELGIGHDDEARLDGVEQRFAESFGLCGKAGDHDVGAQVGSSLQQGILPGTPQL